MFNTKSGIYIIALALFGLLGMQGMWLYYAIKQETKNLETSTRQAAIEVLQELEQKEDSRLILSNLDTLLQLPEFKPASKSSKAKRLKVVVSENSNHGIITKTDKETVTTAYSYSDKGITHSEVKIVRTSGMPNNVLEKKTKAKIKSYEHLLKKIVYQSRPKKPEERINFGDLNNSLKKMLVTRGIELAPEIAVKGMAGKIVFKTLGYSDVPGIKLPMFTKDIVFQNYFLHLIYPSTINYILKKAIGVVLLSLAVTMLLVLVILLLYRKMLTEQKLHQYKNDFINNLTHELKTPLATISLASANIRSAAQYTGQESIHTYTQIIDQENKKLNTHIEKVFELSLLEKEKQIFSVQQYNINELIYEAVKQNAAAIESANAIVNTDTAALHSTVAVDKFHLINALSNIIDNALKYNEGKCVIDIATRNEKNKVLVSIKDNGIGMDTEHLQYIFDKFFRVTRNNIHTTKGFGIGLSYARQTIEQFKGSIAVSSEKNKGSEFIIVLPYVN